MIADDISYGFCSEHLRDEEASLLTGELVKESAARHARPDTLYSVWATAIIACVLLQAESVVLTFTLGIPFTMLLGLIGAGCLGALMVNGFRRLLHRTFHVQVIIVCALIVGLFSGILGSMSIGQYLNTKYGQVVHDVDVVGAASKVATGTVGTIFFKDGAKVYADVARGLKYTSPVGYSLGTGVTCIAPLVTSSSQTTVDFWAISTGDFACTMPPECKGAECAALLRRHVLQQAPAAAVQRAEATFKLKSAPDAKFVEWTNSVDRLQQTRLLTGLGILASGWLLIPLMATTGIFMARSLAGYVAKQHSQ